MTNETKYNLYEKYNFLSEQYTKYVGSSLFIICVFGTIMNMLTFLQRTYSGRACSLYLLVASACDLAHLNLGLLSNILQYGFHYDGIVNSIVHCRIKTYFVYVLTIISGTLTTLASIDRYMLSSAKSSRWNYSHRSVGIRYIKLTILFWIVISIPIIFCSEHFHHLSPNQQVICSSSYQYSSCRLIQIVYICLFNGFLPPFMMMIFSCLTQNNARHLRQRSKSRSIRVRRINKQLTTMLILQSIKSILTSIPYSIFICYWIMTVKKHKSLVHQAIENLINQIVHLFFWSNYTSFFVYIISSDIFRNQWLDTMKKIICCFYRKSGRPHSHPIR
jgi:hypothetical protein